MATQSLAPHGGESLEWRVPGGGPSASREYTASMPPSLGASSITLEAETVDACTRAGLELAVVSRVQRGDNAHAVAVASLQARTEIIASSQLDGNKTTRADLARCEAGLPSTRNGRLACLGVEALVAHIAAAERALGLGAIAAAHTAPSVAPGRRRAANYRAVQTWLGGSDLWPTGADYVPPRPERIPALMDDVVEFCARTDVDPIAQSAVAHAQLLSIQPFEYANGRAARALINGVWRRRGLTAALVVPISAAIAGDRHRYDSAWRAYRRGDADPMVSLVARHALRAVKEATASAERLGAMPQAWREAARPRRGSAAHALVDLLGAHPIVTAAEVRRLTGASQASAYDAIVRLAQAGILRRLTVSRRDAVWVAGDIIDEADRIVERLSGTPIGVKYGAHDDSGAMRASASQSPTSRLR